MKEQFIEHAFSKSSLDRLNLVNGILDEYNGLGFDLSLRQLYYQLVARGHIENSQKSYKRLGDLISNGRKAGLVDWDMITDRGRERVANPHWANPADIVMAAYQSFRIDKWDDQPVRIEVMVEKDALSGVLGPICRDLDIPLTANKGYSSDSLMYGIGKRIEYLIDREQEVHILYLGDHDPSGIDMTRDVRERLEMFSGHRLNVQRLALNRDQVDELNPPENPAKETDSRFQAYFDLFGESSWELDAIEPRALAALVEEAVAALPDEDLWDAAVEREEEMRRELKGFADNYGKNGKAK